MLLLDKGLVSLAYKALVLWSWMMPTNDSISWRVLLDWALYSNEVCCASRFRILLECKAVTCLHRRYWPMATGPMAWMLLY